MTATVIRRLVAASALALFVAGGVTAATYHDMRPVNTATYHDMGVTPATCHDM